MQHQAVFFGQDEFQAVFPFNSSGPGLEWSILQMYPVAIPDGEMGLDAVFQACGGEKTHDIFAGIAAMDQVLRSVLHEQFQRPVGGGQVGVGVG